MSNARAQIRTHSITCEGGKRPGKEATQMHGIKVTFDRIMLPRMPHEDHILFSIASAQRCITYVRRTIIIHSLVTIGPPSSSTHSEKGLGDEATRVLASGQISARRRGCARLPGTYPCLESREPDCFRLGMGATLEKRSGYVYTTLRMCLAPPLFCAREVSRKRGKHSWP